MPKAYIIQTQTYIDTINEGVTKTESSVMAMVCGGKARAQCGVTWAGNPIKIPMVQPSILHCPIIKVEYMLRVSIDPPSVHVVYDE